MITLTTSRQFAEFADAEMFKYVDNLNKMQLKNVEGLDKTNIEYLDTKMIISLLEEVKHLFKKKLITSTARMINIKMSDAAGIAFFKLLLALPIPADHFYFNRIRNLWIEILDQQID